MAMRRSIRTLAALIVMTIETTFEGSMATRLERKDAVLKLCTSPATSRLVRTICM